jgi:Serine/threonine protein kinase
MLTKAGAKLLDFGLAKSGPRVRGTRAQTESAFATTDLTVRGTILGTVQYMAPEQLEALDVDARTDIFAFGAMLFEMITGRKAFVGRTQPSLISAILRDEPPALSSVSVVAPPALDRVIRKCLAKNPDDRWQDASDLRDELRWIAGGGTQSGVQVPAAPRERHRVRVAWALLAVALGAIVILANAVLAARACAARGSIHDSATRRSRVCSRRSAGCPLPGGVAGRHAPRLHRSARR